jgi:hypothetical protein
VWESDAAVVRVPIRNTTDRPIRITNLSTDCRAGGITPYAWTVPPRGEVAVEATLDLTDRHPGEFGRLSRPLQFRLDAAIDGHPRPVRWVINGTCRSRVAASTMLVNFGEANVAGCPPVSRSVTVYRHDPAEPISATSSSSDLIRVSVRSGPNGSLSLVITPDTSRIRGDFAGTIRVETIGPDDRPTGSTTIAVEGTVREPDQSRPADEEKQP